MNNIMLAKNFLNKSVPLPPQLTVDEIFDALQKTQDFFSLIREQTGINLSNIIQSNNFSGVVSNVFTKMLNDVSNYKSFDDQRYPDLKNKDNGIGLEVKASNKPLKGGEGHNGHSGWHIVVCFNVLGNGDIEFIQVEVANLIGYGKQNSDWKYMGSKRNANDSQRTETYVTNEIGTAKLRDGSVYLNKEKVKITSMMKKARNKISKQPIPPYSPLA